MMNNSMDNGETNLPLIIAFYLPQFHPIPENDIWWGKGFTEWTNVTKAKPLFRGHHQPNLPADLGFYDLRLPEAREAQALLAKAYGVSGFAYWHYWFSGKRLLETPFNEVLRLKQPDFPFCLAWANESWSGIWHGNPGKTLIKQTYPGRDDYRAHYEYARNAFADRRYIRIDDKPVFVIYRPFNIPEDHKFISLWNEWSRNDGFSGIHFIGVSSCVEKEYEQLLKLGYSAVLPHRLAQLSYFMDNLPRKIIRRIKKTPFILNYSKAAQYFIRDDERKEHCYPVMIPNWDNSPRSGERALVLTKSSPDAFYKHALETLRLNKRVVFLKSWNEWAEGNYMEPDQRYGLGYLEALKKALSVNNKAFLQHHSLDSQN